MDADDLAALRRHGYTVLPELVPRDRVEILTKAAADHFPAWQDVVAGTDRRGVSDKGLAFRLFPYDADELNRFPFDEALLDLAEQAFDGQPVFLTQSLLRASYPVPESEDQDLHRDYTNNQLLAPSDDPRFGQLAVLVYLTDVDVDTAPTYVCSRSDTDDRPWMPRERSRELDPDLYGHERPVEARAGTAIVYTMANFHRGSKFLADQGMRLAMHLVFRPAACEWMSFTSFGPHFEGPAAVRCMTALTPRQRAVLGVPPPGHPYWTPSTIAAVAERYPEMDVTPYEAASA